MKRYWLFLLLALWTCASRAADPAYLAELQQRAEAEKLAEDVYWHKLLHYRAHTLLPGVTSTVDARDFFLAPDGKANPQTELAATLSSFFEDKTYAGEPAQCRKLARYQWLKRKLQFDAARLPEQVCALYTEYRGNLDAATLSLVFAANDLNSPSTMFGHTLLRVDSKGQTREQRLLAHAINYAAVVGQSNPLSYMLQGASGGFVGEYSIYPYYEKVRQYVRINFRDLWEYRVRLTEDELQRVMWHLWELRNIGSDYFFFTENCSYMLLTLVETAWENERRPSTDFDQLIPLAMPIDTIRALDRLGVLDAPEFRPSMARTLQHKLKTLPETQYDWVLDFATGRATLEDARLTQSESQLQARALEAANDYLNYLFQSESLPRERALPASRETLLALSKITAKSEFPPLPPAPVPPQRGHENTRLSVGVRADQNDSAGLLRWRASYHDRLDPPAGYLPGGQIESFDLGFLLHDQVRVADLRLVSVQSLAPWDRAFRPWLWQVSGGLRRFGADGYRADPQSRLGYYVDGGAGYALGDGARWNLYGFAFGSLDLNQDLNKGNALAGGLRSGFATVWTGSLTQELQVDWLAPLGGGAQRQLRATAELQWQFATQHGLRLGFSRLEFDEQPAMRSGELRWHWYF